MARIRVHELALDLEIDVRLVLARLRELGEFVKGPTSTVEAPVAAKVRSSFGVAAATPPRRPSATRRDHVDPYIDSPSFDPTAPSLRQHGWRSAPVRAPQHPDLLANIDRVRFKYPILREHMDALRSLGSQVVYAGFSRAEGFRDCAIVHVRFSGAIEAGFGFTREVMIFYSPHDDLQGRTFEAAAREVANAGRSVTPDTFFMWSPDRRLRVKLNDWSRPSKLAIPFLVDDEDELSLITLLRDHIYTRDLFYMTTPVHGASFFGRRTLLQSLRDDVFNQRVTGVFGLRKSGKTSILMQLKDELGEDQVVTVLMDLEAFPSPPEDPSDDIVADLRRRLIDELKARRLRTQELSQLADRPTILELKYALQAVLKHLHKSGHRVLLLLDEIEYLTPADRIDIAEGDMPRVAQLLSALRSVVQESDNFTFVLSGLTSAIIEGGRLYGRPNPLFSWAKAVYVKPLEREEADDLASTVGGKMGIQIEPGALEALHQASGGHAYLYRNLSSAVVDHLPTDVFQRTMTRSSVLTELADWKSRVQGNIEEIVQHVKRYYATEAIMLELLIDSPEDFKELASAEHVAVRRLTDLGLIHQRDGDYEVSVLLELV
ncbi:MAG: hypothetical protein K0Q52_80 [Microbacterium sp.]|jgi:hypothetical protein|nr:hypothetical protein [Microbacterium sp.]